jgi:guanine deaminase
MNQFMSLAIEAAKKGMESKMGGPFGAVIVRNGEVVAVAHNAVLGTNDPTAHAEIVAIRRATAKLGRFNLNDCEIYSTCEPCPMWYRQAKLGFTCRMESFYHVIVCLTCSLVTASKSNFRCWDSCRQIRQP